MALKVLTVLLGLRVKWLWVSPPLSVYCLSKLLTVLWLNCLGVSYNFIHIDKWHFYIGCIIGLMIKRLSRSFSEIRPMWHYFRNTALGIPKNRVLYKLTIQRPVKGILAKPWSVKALAAGVSHIWSVPANKEGLFGTFVGFYSDLFAQLTHLESLRLGRAKLHDFFILLQVWICNSKHFYQLLVVFYLGSRFLVRHNRVAQSCLVGIWDLI